MLRLGAGLLLATTLLAASGCVSGLVYQRTVRPLDVNLSGSPVFKRDRNLTGEVRHLAFPIGIISRIDILWDSNAIGDIARRSGMKEIYYADIETERVLTVWRIDTVHLYGK